MTIKKEESKEDKTLYYMIETINVMVENEKILLKRIQKLEEAMDMLADHIYDDDEDEDRIIN
jgi:hypothetical protein|tara:strand:- start:148 stop:333 length:186 start_codon:yes stop_codon:yes gene_type:complete